MKKFMMASAAALACYAGAAQAAPTIRAVGALPLYNLGTGNGGGLQAGPTALAAATPGVTITGLATGTGVYSGSGMTATGNGYTSPFSGGSNQNYFAIQPGGSITFSYGTAQTMFGLLFGTIDSYNNFSFTTNGATPQTFTGTQIASALGMSANGSTSAYVLFSDLNPFTSVTLTDTTSSAFEFVPANMNGVPEPAAWGMMIVGFGLVGGVLRRRQTAVKVRFA